MRYRKLLAVAAVFMMVVTACSSDDDDSSGASSADLDAANTALAAAQSELDAANAQLAAVAPVTVIQAGELGAAPEAVPIGSGWETAEAIRGGMSLYADYDSSGPDAWDVAAIQCRQFTLVLKESSDRAANKTAHACYQDFSL